MVGAGRRLRKVGEEIGVSVRGAPAVFDRMRAGRQNFKPALDASLVFADLSEAFEGFVVAVEYERNMTGVWM